MASDSGDRTVICSVLFADLVAHTTKSVAEQMAGKRRFNSEVEAVIASIPVSERIVLDTGDGAAIAFLGDPEDAFYAAMAIRRGVDGLRIGVNLGPVKLLRDVNGRENIVGDGINVAQRIMSFAESGQILASRSFSEVIACQSADYASSFAAVGARTDKHVREHEVFALVEQTAAFERAAAGWASRNGATAGHADRSVRAVVAEDEPILRDELCELLTALWPELEIVAAVGDGLAAVRAVETLHPDVIFLDIEMPRMTGMEVARAVKGRVHVVMATAYDQHAIAAFEAGVVDYILKPYNVARLLATCERVRQRLMAKPLEV